MAQTSANLADVTKEVWTQDRLEKQFYSEYPWLRRLEKTNRYTIGKKAVVPIHKGRSGGVSVKPPAGGALNAADEQKVDRAEYTVPYNWGQIEIEAAAFNEATGGAYSVGDALDLEVSGMVSDISNQVSRQFVGNGDALIAQATTGGSGAVCNLLNTGYGYDAVVRGWLYPGLLIDLGTTADEVAISDGIEITAVSEDATTPSITLATTPSGEGTTHYVSLKDARSGTTSYESIGLRTIAGSTTSAIGGLDPDTAGEEFWKPAKVDATSTTLSLDLLLDLQRSVMQKGGKPQSLVLTSLKQQANLWSLLQNQTRYSSSKSMDTGEVETVKWNGLEIMAANEIPDREIYFLTTEDLAIVTGARWSKPTWVSDTPLGGGGWRQGYTSFVDGLVYPVGLAIKRRNRFASAIGLTA